MQKTTNNKFVAKAATSSNTRVRPRASGAQGASTTGMQASTTVTKKATVRAAPAASTSQKAVRGARAASVKQTGMAKKSPVAAKSPAAKEDVLSEQIPTSTHEEEKKEEVDMAQLMQEILKSLKQERLAEEATEQASEEKKQEETTLFMFFGMLNLQKLAQIFSSYSWLSGETRSEDEILADLQSKAHPLTCEGYTRVFASHHASVQAHEGAKLETFGVYLTPGQSQITDMFEGVENGYYHRIEVEVTVHQKDGPDTKTTAKVYQMTEQTTEREIREKESRVSDEYAKMCAMSSYLHYKLRGLEPPTEIEVPIIRIGDLKLIRALTMPVAELEAAINAN